jgi:hypothetical protein
MAHPFEQVHSCLRRADDRGRQIRRQQPDAMVMRDRHPVEQRQDN